MFLTIDPSIGFMFHGFLRDPTGMFFTIDVPGASNTYPSGINSAGDVAGTFDVVTNGVRVRHGFILSAGPGPLSDRLITFDVPGSTMTSAFGISDEGDVFGNYRSAADNQNHGFIRGPEGDFITLDVPGSIGTAVKGGRGGGVPEIEPHSMVSALTLLISGMLMLTGRRRQS